MAEEKKEGAEAAAPKPKPPMLVLLLGVNLLATLGAVGMVVYTKMIYQRPTITEDSERIKLTKKLEKKKPVGPPGALIFKPVTVNLDPARKDSGGQGKVHYATIGFTLATADREAEARLETIRPFIEDTLLTLVGKRDYQELTSVQGRFILRNQLREFANQKAKEVLVTDVYFTEFMVQ
ncbi:MAG: hypothetical protein RJB38_979 [Pseudomonadota bacterium]|jgi:flagellar FliL protein